MATKLYKCVFFFIVLFYIPANTNAQGIFIDNEEPGLIPQKFAHRFISQDDRLEFGSIFSSDFKEFYFGVDKSGKAEIYLTTRKGGQWTEPKAIITGSRYGFNDPCLSPDGNRLYYISDLNQGSYDESQDYDIWYSERTADGWSEPINAGPNINSEFDEYYISFTNSGTMYFSSNKAHAHSRGRDFDIYKSESKDQTFLEAQRLDQNINSSAYEADVFVAADESFIIFATQRDEGLGRGDLYISFRDASGNWKEAITMGSTINTKGHELCPWVSGDGRYFFYTSNEDIYWVSTKIFERYRNRK